MQISKKVQAGFTLIELMIVVAIIGILASIAIPQYQDFINKSAFKEITSIAAGDRKVGVELCAQELGTLTGCDASWTGRLGDIPADLAAAVTFTSGNSLATLTTATGVITATTGTDNYGQSDGSADTFILTPSYTKGASVIWTVSGTCLTRKICSQ